MEAVQAALLRAATHPEVGPRPGDAPDLTVSCEVQTLVRAGRVLNCPTCLELTFLWATKCARSNSKQTQPALAKVQADLSRQRVHDRCVGMQVRENEAAERSRRR